MESDMVLSFQSSLSKPPAPAFVPFFYFLKTRHPNRSPYALSFHVGFSFYFLLSKKRKKQKPTFTGENDNGF